MDFVAEIFLEILGKAMIEGGMSAASDHRRPRWQRVLILSLMMLFFAAVFALMTAAGIIMVTESRPLAGAAMLVLDLGLIVCCVYGLRKILCTFSRK